MEQAFRSWIAWSERELRKVDIQGSRRTQSATASALGRMSFLMRIKREPARFDKAWCWPLSPRFIGQVGADCASKIIFGSPKVAARSCVRIRMISGACTQLGKRDKRMTTAARNLNPSSLDASLVEKILAGVREEEIVAMACDVINIPSPTGEELQMAEYMHRALQQLGLAITWQEVEDGRANVVGRWPGRGGKNLMFNGHMDTSNTGREEFL